MCTGLCSDSSVWWFCIDVKFGGVCVISRPASLALFEAVSQNRRTAKHHSRTQEVASYICLEMCMCVGM